MSDYERIAQAITFITSQANTQPGLRDIAAHCHISEYHFQRLFSRWAGVSPKRFLQALTVERAKQLLRESKPLVEVSESAGLSSSSRLHDHFVQLEAVTPGEYKLQGVGLNINYGIHDTPFGSTFIAITKRGICKLSFMDFPETDEQLFDLKKTWPQATLLKNQKATITVVNHLFNTPAKPDKPLSLHVSGTNFQINVWKALLQIPPATVTSYAHIASAIGKSNAARAVGQAIGANPVAFIIPCHRVIQQSGALGGYHWGITRKHAIHAWETARSDQSDCQD